MWKACTILLLAPLMAAASSGEGVKTISGFSEPYRHIEVASPESGVISAVKVKEGEKVSAGQVLVSLDTTVLDAYYRTAKARSEADGAVKVLEVKVSLKQKIFAQMEELRKTGSATLNEVEKAQADLSVAEAELESAKEAIAIHELECRQIQAQIDRRHIKSPIDGVVVELTKDIAESVSVADPYILTIASLDKLRVVCYEEPARISSLSVGSAVALKFDGVDEQVKGEVDHISPVVDPESGTVKLEIVVQNADGSLKSGTRCDVVLGE